MKGSPISFDSPCAAELGHMAYWGNRVLVVAEKIDRGEPRIPSDAAPEGDWVNDSTREIIHAIATRASAELAPRIAEEADAGVAALPWTGWLRSTG